MSKPGGSSSYIKYVQSYVVQNIIVGAVPSVASDKLRKPVPGSAKSSLKDFKSKPNLRANCQLF